MTGEEKVESLMKALAMAQSHLEVATAEVERLRGANEYYISILTKVGADRIKEACDGTD